VSQNSRHWGLSNASLRYLRHCLSHARNFWPCGAEGAGFRVQGAGCRVQGAGCRVQSAGFCCTF